MASCTPQGAKLLNGWKAAKIFDKGIGLELPQAYKKFWKEWKETKPTAVHYIHRDEKWERNELTGEVKPVQNIPIPIIYPAEHHEGIWGGEGVVKGFQKRDQYKRRVPHFWVPVLRRTVVYSEILDKYMAVVVTNRTLNLIHENYGLDHYLLKTLACDLKSELALQIKRRMLKALEKNCPAYAGTPELQAEVYNRYKNYLSAYSSEEIDWYGLSFSQACTKLRTLQSLSQANEPLKHKYRFKLIQKLKEAGIQEFEDLDNQKSKMSSSWLNKMNPFSKKET
ncbi:39S ribosomal protein L28, mitochondrial [Chrysoperla carnea]|uniref:39S ribosomal protein L28, mitochondrial n=1 Tax=Chrysoperla carnea TaxID=189513 RepID=UPI001D05F447|nr:39S ribosomal protein L28, mitochondrial [Chrysoperla carnea]